MKALITQFPFNSLDSSEMAELGELGVEVHENPFRTIPSEDQLIKIIYQYDFIISGSAKLTAKVLQHAENLKLIARAGTGIDNVDLDYITQKGIALTYTPDAPSYSVAEYTFSAIIGLARNIFSSINSMKSNKWNKINGNNLNKLTLGIIGLNRIGKELVKMAAPFGITIIANDVQEDQDFANAHHVQYVPFEELIKSADIISLHIPLNQSTHNLLNLSTFKKMKPTASIINTARGGIINEADLYEALQQKHIAFAVLDVFEEEPYTGNLLSLQNCICTSHIAGASKESAGLMETSALKEIISFVKNEPLANLYK